MGDTVLGIDGVKLGHVSEVFVSFRSGRTTLSIRPEGSHDDGRVIMLPRIDLEPASEPDVFVARRIARSINAA